MVWSVFLVPVSWTECQQHGLKAWIYFLQYELLITPLMGSSGGKFQLQSTFWVKDVKLLHFKNLADVLKIELAEKKKCATHMDFTVEGKLLWVWPGRLGTGMGLGKRNFLIKERKLSLPLWLFSIKCLILCGCEQTLCPSAPLPAPTASPGAGTQGAVCVSAHLALKSVSKINFLLLQQFGYYIKMPLQFSLFVLTNCRASGNGNHSQSK